MKRYLLFLIFLSCVCLSVNGQKITVRNVVDYDFSRLFSTSRIDLGGIGARYANGGNSTLRVYLYDVNEPNGRGPIIYSCTNNVSTSYPSFESQKTEDPPISYSYAGITMTISDLRQTKHLLQRASIPNVTSCSGIKPFTFPNTSMGSVYDNALKRALIPVSYYNISPECASIYNSNQKILIELDYQKGFHYLIALPDDNNLLGVGRLFFNAEHGCASYSGKEDAVCERIMKIKQITYTGKNIEVVPVAHRGVWGGDLGNEAPENSAESINAAKSKGIPYVEVDVMSTKDNVLVCLHDYNLERLTDYGSEGYIFDKNWSDISRLKLKRRNNTVSTSNILSFSTLLEIVKRDQLILFIDIKELQARNKDGHCIANCDYVSKDKQKESWLKILNLCYNEISNKGLLNQVVFKTYYDFQTIANVLTLDKAKKIQYVPMLISNNFNKSIGLATQFVDQWMTGNALGTVTYFETDFFNGEDIQLRPFFMKGNRYDNIMDYIYTKHGLRSGIFSEEPVGRAGVTNRWAEWKMKNTTSDFRGDHLELMKYKFGNYMVITTDRTDIWQIFMKYQN